MLLKAKELLEKNFKLYIDYKILLCKIAEQDNKSLLSLEREEKKEKEVIIK